MSPTPPKIQQLERISQVRIPSRVVDVLSAFLDKGKTGNIKLNIKDGEIRGYHVEEFVTLKNQ